MDLHPQQHQGNVVSQQYSHSNASAPSSMNTDATSTIDRIPPVLRYAGLSHRLPESRQYQNPRMPFPSTQLSQRPDPMDQMPSGQSFRQIHNPALPLIEDSAMAADLPTHTFQPGYQGYAPQASNDDVTDPFAPLSGIDLGSHFQPQIQATLFHAPSTSWQASMYGPHSMSPNRYHAEQHAMIRPSGPSSYNATPQGGEDGPQYNQPYTTIDQDWYSNADLNQ